ncbi:MAG: N-acetyl-gamma-glutamyl-phosphate reductase [Methylococcales bacterium]|nr:N-acetyl-gamma-glutamyl-phosphate reductase [Methylococcales bacterium]
MTETTIKAGIVGGTGYTGVELLRLLARHPRVIVHCVTSRGDAGQAIASVYPSLAGFVDGVFVEPDVGILSECDVVFFATPNGTAMSYARALLDKGVKVIDLSADFRLQDPDEWRHWYQLEHACPELLPEAVYGLPEWHREAIRSADLVACPGCYPTSVQLGLLPLLAAKVIEPGDLVADVKSGASGAGRKAALNLLVSETGESFKAYGASGHRHWPEVRQGLNRLAETSVDLTFVPHLLPMIRGIHATLYTRLKDNEADIQALFEQRYRHERFVNVLPQGAHPDTRSVKGSNFCQLAIHRPQGPGRRLLVLVVIDNLVKGASGQAVQNMNLMFGFDEASGLEVVPVYP